MFLNVPYDAQFENLFLAYIAAVSAFGFVPRAALEVPFTKGRLDRITELIEECGYSIHDLSRVQLDRTPPSTPRFNIPCELGLAIALAKWKRPQHTWVVCESMDRRIDKSLSDLRGTDVYIHGGTIQGLFRELGNIFVRSAQQPSVQQMMAIYLNLRKNFQPILHRAGQTSPFNARVFRNLCTSASAAADELVILREDLK